MHTHTRAHVHRRTHARSYAQVIQDQSTLSQYAPGVDSADLVDGFGEIFARCVRAYS